MHVLKGVEAVVFDLDGTLVEAMPYQELLVWVANNTDVPVETLLARYYSVPFDLKEARNYHLSLCANDVQREDVLSAYVAFVDAKKNPKIINGAHELLQSFRQKNLFLACWTRGSPETQKQTLISAGLADYFDVVVAVSKKTADTIKTNLLPVLAGRKFVLIGDSFEQDILPALGLAEKLFWVSGSRVNKSGFGMNPSAIFLPDSVTKIDTVADLLSERSC